MMFTPLQFKGERPTARDTHQGDQRCGTVPARLWQDPFEAVNEHRRKEAARTATKALFDVAATVKSKPIPSIFSSITTCSKTFLSYTGNKLKADFTDRISGKKIKTKVTVIGVMTPTGSSFEEAESRRRYRYAALSGMQRLGFVPMDPTHIQYFEIDRLIVPYEWLERTQTDNDRVLLLWLDEDGLGIQKPLDNLRKIERSLLTDDKDVKFRIMGPSKLETLDAMKREAQAAGKNGPPADAARNIEIYGCLAREIENHGPSPGAGKQCGTEPRQLFSSAGFSFTSLVSSEQCLAITLLKELELRHVGLDNGNSMIALVGEWDTAYSRALPVMYSTFALGKNV